MGIIYFIFLAQIAIKFSCLAKIATTSFSFPFICILWTGFFQIYDFLFLTRFVLQITYYCIFLWYFFQKVGKKYWGQVWKNGTKYWGKVRKSGNCLGFFWFRSLQTWLVWQKKHNKLTFSFYCGFLDQSLSDLRIPFF